MIFLKSAWDDVSTKAIQNCFAKCGFVKQNCVIEDNIALENVSRRIIF